MASKHWLGIFASVVVVGCTKPTSVSVRSPAQTRPTGASSQPEFQRFDLGPVLARDEPLRHEFTINNPTANLVRIVQSAAMKPCCSSIEEHSQEIQPYGRLAIPVVLKPGRSSGNKSVTFLVETDQRGHNHHLLELVADLRPEWEVVAAESNPRSVPLGAGAKMAFEVICRRQGEVGFRLPDAIEASAPCRSTNDPSKSTSDQTGTFIESRQPIVIDVPPSTHIGLHRESLLFRWNDGNQRNHDFAWEVVAAVRANPSILIFKEDEAPKDCSVALSSDQHPFRIVSHNSLSSVEMLQLPAVPGRVQKVVFRVDPSRIDSEATSEIRFRTDHPDQPEVTIKVMILGGAGRESER